METAPRVMARTATPACNLLTPRALTTTEAQTKGPSFCSFFSQLEIKPEPEVPQCQTPTAKSRGERLDVPRARK